MLKSQWLYYCQKEDKIHAIKYSNHRSHSGNRTKIVKEIPKIKKSPQQLRKYETKHVLSLELWLNLIQSTHSQRSGKFNQFIIMGNLSNKSSGYTFTKATQNYFIAFRLFWSLLNINRDPFICDLFHHRLYSFIISLAPSSQVYWPIIQTDNQLHYWNYAV